MSEFYCIDKDKIKNNQLIFFRIDDDKLLEKY